jgi:steroid delta-isomerase-like uncharacterized protein
MSAQENKVLARYYLEQIFNQKNLAAINEFYSPDLADYGDPQSPQTNLEHYRTRINSLMAAFPDLRVEYQDFTCEADRVFSRYTLSGTHQGEFAEIPATGKRVRVSGMDMLRFKDGKVVEHWTQLDMLGFMQQLG